MKIEKALVLGDEYKSGKLDDGKPWENRTLTVVEIDPNPAGRLVPQVAVKIPLSDSITGDVKQGASIVGSFVELAITDLKQDEKTKKVVFTGSVVKLGGQMQEGPVGARKGPEGAKAA